MAVFDGSNYIQRATTLKGAVDTKKLLFSGWFSAADGSGGVVFSGGPSALARVFLSFNTSNGAFNWILRDSSNTALWNVSTQADLDDGTPVHLATSVDLSTQETHVYVNGEAATLTVTTAATDGTIDIEGSTQWNIAQSYDAGGVAFGGSMFDLALWLGISLDLSDDDNLQLLVAKDSTRLATDPSGVKPAGYGHQGIYLGKEAALLFGGAFQQNRGTGGAFTATSTFDEDDTSGTNSPNPWRLHPTKQTPGVRWFLSEQSGEPYAKSDMTVEQREGLTNYGRRIGLDEVDAPTRRERPGMNYSDLILGHDEEDHEDLPR